MGRFKVGDLVRVKKDLKGNNHYGGLFFGPTMEKFRGYCFEVREVDYYGQYKLVGTENRYFNDEMLEEATKLTFLEVLNNIKEGEEWVNTKVGCISFVTCNDGIIHFGSDTRIKNLSFKTDDIAGFALVEKRKPTIIYHIEHAEGGKIYYFVSDDRLEEDDFVVCGTIKGKSYGRVKAVTVEDKTEEEIEAFKKCWRAC